MKNLKYIAILSILLLISIITMVYFNDRAGSTQKESASNNDASKPPHARGSMRKTSRSDEAERVTRDPSPTNRQSAEKIDPLNKKTFSSTVNIEIAAGETLVTGGYQRANGQYELTFLTPTSVIQEDGSEAIKLSSRILSVDPSFISENKLGALTTRTRNTLQHAEAWNQDKLSNTLKAASQHQNTDIMSSPSILAHPGKTAKISRVIHKTFSQTRFTIESNITTTSDGSFVIKARVERASLD